MQGFSFYGQRGVSYDVPIAHLLISKRSSRVLVVNLLFYVFFFSFVLEKNTAKISIVPLIQYCSVSLESLF
jgi:hypothetical protein